MDWERRVAELEAQLAQSEARNAELRIQVQQLQEQVQFLLQKLQEKSGPPTSNKSKTKTKKTKTDQKKRGAKFGHKGHSRQLVPEDQVDHIIELCPQHCENCRASLEEMTAKLMMRAQLFELPELACTITEYRRYQKTCRCGFVTKAPAQGIPSSPFGPRLMSFIVLLVGVYQISRRQTRELLIDLLGLKISLGGISNVERQATEAIKPAFEDAKAALNNQTVKYTDGTSWRREGRYEALWVVATRLVTVYQILSNATADTLQKTLGSLKGIFVSDRAKTLNFWAMKDRQICWAHLLRKFIDFCERDGPAAQVGFQLVDLTSLLFEYWQAYKRGDLDRATFRLWMVPVRKQIIQSLERGQALAQTRGSCADALLYRQALFTFVDREGVEPTNNHAEQQLRRIVLWRKRCQGTQSARGDRFVERVMTVWQTSRKQGVDVFSFLTGSLRSHLLGTARPTLIVCR